MGEKTADSGGVETQATSETPWWKTISIWLLSLAFCLFLYYHHIALIVAWAILMVVTFFGAVFAFTLVLRELVR